MTEKSPAAQGGSAAESPTQILSRIKEPRDLDGLSNRELRKLAVAMRAFLIDKVSVTGGHLGPNLGVVELSIAMHRVFNSPNDAIIFDTGHQCYPHKILTGRQGGFEDLRIRGGLSGYPSAAESEHDWVESSHASAALSYADGLAKAFELAGTPERRVVAVVGDGALTGGMSWEALNNIAAGDGRPIVIVVNDNGRSYAPTSGGIADRLARLRTRPGYERVMAAAKEVAGIPLLGRAAYSAVHALKEGLKDALAPQALYADLGIKYVGPVDGHDIEALERALEAASEFGRPVIVHAVTRKGMGYPPAEQDPNDQMHACGPIDRITGRPLAAKGGAHWTDVFSDELIKWGELRPDVVAITAAMAGPTGLSAFGARFPGRLFDVGIAEQHAVTSAAGLALGGMHPVVALYSTFLNRAFDQVLMDVALLRLPVTLILDRSGVTGPDGPSHNGMWDLSLLNIIPGLRVAAPRDALSLREAIAEALDVTDGPTAIRFPKGPVSDDVVALARVDGVDVLRQADRPDVLIVVVGPMAATALDATEILRGEGVSVCVIDPRWVLPVSDTMVKIASKARLVVTIEESGLNGGVGSAVAQRMRDLHVDTPTRHIGLPQQFLDLASRGQIHRGLGLEADAVARTVGGWLTGLTGVPAARST